MIFQPDQVKTESTSQDGASRPGRRPGARGSAGRWRAGCSAFQLGRVAQDRGELDEAQTWYEKSLGTCLELLKKPGRRREVF